MKSSTIKIIVAVDENGGIGWQGKLPWNSQSDLRAFSRETTGSDVIMGRKTWESLPDKYRPLPNRGNYVLSSLKSSIHNTRDNYNLVNKYDGASWGTNLLDIIEHIKYYAGFHPHSIYIIGGAQLYSTALQMNIVDQIIMTRMKNIYQTDTFFPRIPTDKCKWERQVAERCRHWDRIIYEKVV